MCYQIKINYSCYVNGSEETCHSRNSVALEFLKFGFGDQVIVGFHVGSISSFYLCEYQRYTFRFRFVNLELCKNNLVTCDAMAHLSCVQKLAIQNIIKGSTVFVCHHAVCST